MSISSRTVEILIGACVIAVSVYFFYDAYTRRAWQASQTYTLQAYFDHADGLVVGSDVKISGVKVGAVTALDLDPKTYRAWVRLCLKQGIQLSRDTSAEIGSDGLLGGKHLRLVMGNADDMLAHDDVIEHTQSLPSLESLIGQMVFSSKKSEGSSESRAVP